MKNTIRFTLITLTLAGLSSACVNTSTSTRAQPVEVQVEESSFRLFPAPGTPSSTDSAEAHGSVMRVSMRGEPVASHPRQTANYERSTSLRAVVSALRNMIVDTADGQIGRVVRHDAAISLAEAQAREPAVVHAHDIRNIAPDTWERSGASQSIS